MPDDLKLLPDEVRERAIELMFELNNDPPEQPLTRETAGQWVDYQVYRENWHADRIARREDHSDHPEVGPHRPTRRHVSPHPEAWIGERDLDAMLAVFNALTEAGEDAKSYWGGKAPKGSRTTSSTRSQRAVKAAPSRDTARSGLALLLASPLLLVGYAIAALFTTIPLYLVLSAVADDYTLVPDTEQELFTAGAIVAVLAGWYFVSGISKALSDRPS